MKRASFVDASFVKGFVEFRNRSCLSMLAHNMRLRCILQWILHERTAHNVSGLCSNTDRNIHTCQKSQGDRGLGFRNLHSGIATLLP